jgi:hypothetical protein
MVDIWIIAATSATLDGVLPDSFFLGESCLILVILVRLGYKQQSVTSGSICPCDCFPGFTGCHRYGGKISSLIMYLYLCFLWVWVCHFFSCVFLSLPFMSFAF